MTLTVKYVDVPLDGVPVEPKCTTPLTRSGQGFPSTRILTFANGGADRTSYGKTIVALSSNGAAIEPVDEDMGPLDAEKATVLPMTTDGTNKFGFAGIDPSSVPRNSATEQSAPV
jgi:hypothetical protein|tara:strand:+ start:268 stop:612 length:345 start_codon:yes stop_codon:yes gene_type:complete